MKSPQHLPVDQNKRESVGEPLWCSVTAVTTHGSGELSASIRCSTLIARPPLLQTTLLTAGRQTEDSYAHMHTLTFVRGGDVGLTARQGGVARWVWNRPL